MTPTFAAIVISFLSGMCGYIIAFMWIRPIAKYLKLKREIRNYIKPFWIDYSNSSEEPPLPDKIKGWEERNNQFAIALKACFTRELPNWYRMSLAHKKEKPIEAADLLTDMAETKKLDLTQKRALKVKELLRL